MQYQPNNRGNPASSSGGQGAPLGRINSNNSNMPYGQSRSPSLAVSEGGAENIRAHADSISQMLDTAHNNKLPQSNIRNESFLNVDNCADPIHRSNSDSSGTATEGIYSAPLQRDGEQAATSYFTSKGRRSSDGSMTRTLANPDAPRPPRSPLTVESAAHAHGQIDPVPEEARAPGLQTTEGCDTNAAGETTAYHFSDRPGVDREAKDVHSGSKAGTPKPRSLKSDDGKNAGPSNRPSKTNKEKKIDVTEVRSPIHQQHEPTEPDVGPAIERSTDMTDIVRLGDIGEDSISSKKTHSKRGVSPNELSPKNEDPRPAVNRLQSVDHQQSVRNFVTLQAQTVNMPDPNASTPCLSENDDEDGDYMATSRHRHSNTLIGEDDDFGMDSPARSVDLDEEPGDVAENDLSNSSRQTDSQSQVSTDIADEPVMTVRFEHVTTEDGHHVVVGREGKLEKCEDEVRWI